MGMRAERPARHGSARAGQAETAKRKPELKKIWPQVKTLVAPRLGLLAAGLALMVVNRLSGLVLPYKSKALMDSVLSTQHPHPEMLPRIIAMVFAAMVVQAITSFSLTQLLSKAGQRLIAEMRRQVQKHVGLLSVAYYDENRTGTLVARIMTDVEGVRNLVGTGLVEFVGGMLTALLSFIYLLHLSIPVTLTVFAVMGVFVVVLQYGFKTIRPIFRERGKINAEVTGRLTESLGGVRVIKGYHAEEREAGVFSEGVDRLLQNVMKSLTMTSTLSAASTTVLGLVSSIVMWAIGPSAAIRRQCTLAAAASAGSHSRRPAPMAARASLALAISSSASGCSTLDRSGRPYWASLAGAKASRAESSRTTIKTFCNASMVASTLHCLACRGIL